MNIGVLMLIVGVVLSALSLMGLHEQKPAEQTSDLKTAVANCYPIEL